MDENTDLELGPLTAWRISKTSTLFRCCTVVLPTLYDLIQFEQWHRLAVQSRMQGQISETGQTMHVANLDYDKRQTEVSRSESWSVYFCSEEQTWWLELQSAFQTYLKLVLHFKHAFKNAHFHLVNEKRALVFKAQIKVFLSRTVHFRCN